MQKSLSYIEPHLNAVLNAIDDAVLIVDQNYLIEYLNSEAERLLGLSKAFASGHPVAEVLKIVKDKEIITDVLKRASSKESKVVSESIILTKIENKVPVEISVSLVKDNNDKLGFIIVLKNKDVEETRNLKESERKYKSLFDNVLEGIFIMDNNGTIVDSNPRASEIYKINKTDFIGKDIYDLFPHKSKEEADFIWKEFLRTGYLFGLYKYELHNGDIRYIDFKNKANFLPGLHLTVFSDVTQKKLTENALKMSEANLKAIFENSIQVIVLIDLNYKIITVNENGQKIANITLGKSLETGEDLFKYTGEFTDNWKEKLELVKKGQVVSEEIHIPQMHNQNQWFEFNFTPVYSDKKLVKGICITATDISYRKNTELSLAESEARFRSLVQNSSDIITILSEKGKISFISPSIKRILGYNSEELIGKNYHDLIHPEDVEQIEKILKGIQAKDKSSTVVEYRFLHVSRYYITLETTFNNLTTDPFIQGIVLNSRDISERKFQEENLLLLERAIDSSRNGILISDPAQPDNPIIYVNKSFENITGYNYQDLINRNCRFLQGDDLNQPEIAKIRKAIKEEKEVSVVLRNYKKDGTLFWNQLSISPVFNRKDQLANYIGVITDITEKKVSEDALLEITQGVSKEGDKDFYKSIASHFANILHTDIIIIGEIDHGSVRTKIVYKDGIIADNFEYTLKNSPCGAVLENGSFTSYDSVKKDFPAVEYFADEKIESYAGAPLVDSVGNVIGIVLILHRHKIPNIQLAESLLNIFSVRISSELERDNNISALKSSEKKFRSLSENSPDLIYIIDLGQRKVIYFNWTEIFEYRSKELEISDAWIKIVHPDDMQRVILHWNKFLQSAENSESIEYRLKKKNGVYEWVVNRHTVIERNELGMAVQVLLNITIITERKKAEEALRESEARLTALIENTNDIVWSIDKDFYFTAMNSAFKNLFKLNYRKQLNIGDNLIDTLPLSLKEEWIQLHTRALHGERFSIEFVEFAKNKNLSYEVSYNPIYSEDGQISGVSVFARDITQRKISEDNIIRTNFELDSFVYRASHDLRAPLRSVLGLINIARTEENRDQRNAYFDLVDKSINKLDTFISDLTNFSRNSRLEVNIENIDFQQIINECIDNLKYMENAELVKIGVEVDAKAEFHSDTRRLSIVLQNLLSNSIKYQNLRIDDAYVKIRVAVSKKEAHIIVSDNGKGIKEEYLDKIFNMFFRASHDSYGSGLGLYIAKQVIEKLNGTITVKSEISKGTEFTIAIPNMNK